MHAMTHRQHILVLRGGALGDFVLTLPVLQALRAARPDAGLTLAAYPHACRLAAAGGLADACLSLDAPWAARLFAADCAPLDGDAAGIIRDSAAILSCLHDPDGVVERNLRRMARGRVAAWPALVTAGHAADHFAGALAALGIPPPAPAVPRLTLPPARLRTGRERLAAYGERVVTLHPGSGSPRKNWPAERFADLARRLMRNGLGRPVWVVGEADAAAWDEVRRLVPGAPVIREPDVVELAALLAAAACHVGNDSGVTHLAAAVGTPTVALFGPTDPGRWCPRGKRVRILRAPEGRLDGLAVEPVLAAAAETVPAQAGPATAEPAGRGLSS